MAKKAKANEKLTEAIQIKHSSLIKLLLGLYHTKVPTMIWSRPGCGKTATVTSMGKILNVPTIMRSGNKADPTDFSGIPYLAGDGMNKELRISKPSYIRELEKSKKGILFFDEINTCPTSIQVALLSIIQDCQFGEFTIPETTFRVAAGNYAETAGNKQMSAALMNRFVHLFVEPDPNKWCEGFVSGFKNYEQPIINSESEQIDKLLKYRLSVVDFIKENPQYMSQYPDSIVVKTDVAYPTMRSWEMVTKILSVLDQNDDEYLLELISGTVGPGVASLYMSFLKEHSSFHINLNDYLEKEWKFELPNPDKIDEVDAIMQAVIYYLNIDPQKYLKLWIRVVNLLCNKDGRYGNYPGYTNFVMSYLHSVFNILISSKTINPSTGFKYLSEQIESYDELMQLMNGI